MTGKPKVIISNTMQRGDKYKYNEEKLCKAINDACHEENILMINHKNINPKRYLNRSKSHFNNYGNSVFVKILPTSLSNLI